MAQFSLFFMRTIVTPPISCSLVVGLALLSANDEEVAMGFQWPYSIRALLAATTSHGFPSILQEPLGSGDCCMWLITNKEGGTSVARPSFGVGDSSSYDGVNIKLFIAFEPFLVAVRPSSGPRMQSPHRPEP